MGSNWFLIVFKGGFNRSESWKVCQEANHLMGLLANVMMNDLSLMECGNW